MYKSHQEDLSECRHYTGKLKDTDGKISFLSQNLSDYRSGREYTSGKRLAMKRPEFEF